MGGEQAGLRREREGRRGRGEGQEEIGTGDLCCHGDGPVAARRNRAERGGGGLSAQPANKAYWRGRWRVGSKGGLRTFSVASP